MQRIDAVKQGVAVAFGAAIHVHLTLQLGALVVGAEGFQFMDEFTAGACRHYLAGLYGIHQQLQLRQLEGPLPHKPARRLALSALDIQAEGPQGLQVVVDALPLRCHVPGRQRVDELLHRHGVFLVGTLQQGLLQNQSFQLLIWASRHGLIPFPDASLAAVVSVKPDFLTA